MLRRAFAYGLLFLAFAGVISGRAAAAGQRHAAFVLDVNSGAVLHNDDGDAVRHPASLTKMMTLYLTFELLQSGRLKMTDMIAISERAASVAPSKLDLKPGAQISVADGIKAVVTKSANDIAVALAERIGGTEANFVRLMNTRARELGMKQTHFENPSGLPDADHVSSARDMATLALRLMDDFPSYYTVFSTRTFAYRGKSYRNHNTMLNTFSGVDGIKTGYTRASGFNLVTSVHRGGRHLVGVVFGGSTAASRNAEMRVLLTKAFTRASTKKTRKPTLIAKLNGAPKLAAHPGARDRKASALAASDIDARPTDAPPQRVAEARVRETPIRIFKVKHVPLIAKPAAASADDPIDTQDTQSTDDSSSGDGDTIQTASADRDAGYLAAAERLGERAEMLGSSGGPPEHNSDRISGRISSPPAEVQRPAPVARRVAFAPASEPVAAIEPSSMPAAPADQIAGSSSEPRQRGLPPSTLNAQAWALAGRAPQQPQRMAPSAQLGQRQAMQVSAAAGGYEVQIGAYGSIADAQRALNSVQDRARKLLAGVPSVTHPGTVNGRQIFRARFAGFNADRAASTCTELRRKGVDCFVMASQ